MASDYTTPTTVVVSTPPATSAVLGTNVTAVTPSTKTLPFTGGDIAGITVVGVGLLGAGVVLVRRNRSKTASN
jgi:uncharacterized membrane protein YhiD involved in acid resistance